VRSFVVAACLNVAHELFQAEARVIRPSHGGHAAGEQHRRGAEPARPRAASAHRGHYGRWLPLGDDANIDRLDDMGPPMAPQGPAEILRL